MQPAAPNAESLDKMKSDMQEEFKEQLEKCNESAAQKIEEQAKETDNKLGTITTKLNKFDFMFS